MKKRLIFLFIILSISGGLFAQTNIYDKYVDKIDSVQIRKHLTILASDEFEGRGILQAGGEKTQNYLAEELNKMGIKSGNGDSYLQVLEELNTDGKSTANVLGIIEGSDLKDEYILLMAHHDHLGNDDEIFNGADDNASSVSAILEIGRIIAEAKKDGTSLRRSILIMFTTGEESRFLGAKHYIKNPIIPIQNIKGCINLEMIGRKMKEYETKNDNNYLYVLAENRYSGNMPEQLEKINNDKLKLDYGMPSYFFRGSDHYPFALADIPTLCLSAGGMHPDYHQPTDDTERIDFEGIWKRARLVYSFVCDIANAENK